MTEWNLNVDKKGQPNKNKRIGSQEATMGRPFQAFRMPKTHYSNNILPKKHHWNDKRTVIGP